MRLPNGYGSCYKLKGARRRPWIARKTIGWDDEGKQLYQTIGYFESRQKALTALAAFNENPYSMETATITFAEVYEKWSREKFPKIANSNVLGYRSAFKKSEPLHGMRFVDIRKAHMQPIIDNCDKGWGTKKKIKVLFNQLFKFALENDIISKDYSRYVTIDPNDTPTNKKPFTREEIKTLWENVDRMEGIDTILIMIYTGLRPGELLDLRMEDIDLKQGILRGGGKTRAGKNRVIPIHKDIFQLIRKRMLSGKDHLITNHKGEKMKYENYLREKFRKIMEQLEMDHLPHECRHTFATLMDEADANKICIKRIMGHASADITDGVYTHKDIKALAEAINLIC